MAKTKKDDAQRFAKEQFLTSARFEDNTDLVMALLDDNEIYSIEEVEILINNYLNEEVD